MSTKPTLNEYTALIHYYIRRNLFHDAANLAKEAYKTFDDPSAAFWAAFAAFKAGARQEAMSLLTSVERYKELAPLQAKLRNLLNNEKENRMDSISRQALSDSISVNFAFFNIYLDNLKEAKTC